MRARMPLKLLGVFVTADPARVVLEHPAASELQAQILALRLVVCPKNWSRDILVQMGAAPQSSCVRDRPVPLSCWQRLEEFPICPDDWPYEGGNLQVDTIFQSV